MTIKDTINRLVAAVTKLGWARRLDDLLAEAELIRTRELAAARKRIAELEAEVALLKRIRPVREPPPGTPRKAGPDGSATNYYSPYLPPKK